MAQTAFSECHTLSGGVWHSLHSAPYPAPIPTLYQVTMGCGLPSMTAWN